jgi:hypothetical protein
MKTVRDYLQRWAEGQPFRPFVLRLEDGRAIPVTRLARLRFFNLETSEHQRSAILGTTKSLASSWRP